MGRRKKINEQVFFALNGTTSTGTADGDIYSFVAPASIAVGRSVVRGSTNGTGTATIDFTIRDTASGGGTALSGGHKSSAGADYDLDAASGVNYIADGNGVFTSDPGEGGTGAIFVNANFDAGTATGAGTFRYVLLVIL